MQLIVTTVDGFQALTIHSKHSIFGVSGVLYLPLNLEYISGFIYLYNYIEKVFMSVIIQRSKRETLKKIFATDYST